MKLKISEIISFILALIGIGAQEADNKVLCIFLLAIATLIFLRSLEHEKKENQRTYYLIDGSTDGFKFTITRRK